MQTIRCAGSPCTDRAVTDLITYERADHIAWITINRPEKRNAMTTAMIQEFATAFERANSDEGARVVVLSGSGGSFCAGVDLKDLASRSEEQRGEGPPSWFILRCSKPVIGAIDGVAVGMGAEFTSMCDVRIASSSRSAGLELRGPRHRPGQRRRQLAPPPTYRSSACTQVAVQRRFHFR